MTPILRDYQARDIERISVAFRTHRTILYQLMVGGGKTVLFSEISRRAEAKGSRVLILVHRKELITQAYSSLVKFGVMPGVIKAGFKSNPDRLTQLASIQTLVRRNGPEHVDLIIVDEAHRGVADSYAKIYAMYPNARVLGVTATPWRFGKTGFNKDFEHLICGPTAKELISRGYLVRPRVLAKPLDLNLSKVKIVNGDYDEKEIAKVMDDARIHGDLIRSYERYGGGRQMLVFAVNVAHSKHIRDQYVAAGYDAEHLDGGSPEEERDRIISSFRSGKTRILCNCNLFTEGFDVPGCGVVQLVRPTKSLVQYIQAIGRGMRVESGKDDCIILDHANNVIEHGLPHEDREWNLSGKSRRIKERKDSLRVMATLDDGKMVPIDADKRFMVDGLVELTEIPDGYVAGSSIRQDNVSIGQVEKMNRLRNILSYKLSQLPEGAPEKEVRVAKYVALQIWEQKVQLHNINYQDCVMAGKELGYKDGWAEKRLIELQRQLAVARAKERI